MKIFVKSIFLFLLGLSITKYCNGQLSFSKTYDNEGQTVWGYSLEVDATCIYTVGNGNTDLIGLSSFFMKCDENGNQVTMSNFAQEHVAFIIGEPGTLNRVSNESFIAGGKYSYFDTIFPINQGEHGLLYKYTRNGDTVFTRKMIGNGRAKILNTDVYKNIVYLTGYTNDTSASKADFYVAAYDTSGIFLWENTFEAEFSTVGLTISNASNGNIICAGGIDHDDVGSLTDGWIIWIDTFGNKYSDRQYGTPFDDGGIRLKITKDEHYFLALHSIDTTINTGDYQYVRSIGKMDTSGNYLWRTFFNQPLLMYLWNFRELEDKSIVACGFTEIDETGWNHGYICKLDSNGVKLWERTYETYNDHDNYFTDVQQTPDKGFILTGTAWGPVNQDMWLVKLDSMGCLIPGCDETPVINPSISENAIFKIYPNPINNIATVEIKTPEALQIIPGEKLHLNIYDINGKLVDTYSNIQLHNPDEVIRFNIYKKNLAPGIYEATLIYGGIRLGMLKIVVE